MSLFTSLTLISIALSCSPAFGTGLELVGGEDLEALIERYRAEQVTVRMRLELVEEIAALGTPEAREFLARICRGTEPALLKRVVFDALRNELAPPPEELLEWAALDGDPYLRAHTLEILAAADRKAAERRIRDAMTRDEDVRVRLTAIELLGRGADPRTARFLFKAAAVLGPREQRQAVATLAALSKQAFDPLLGGEEPWWAERDVKVSLRLLGALVLSARGEESGKKALVSLTRDRDPRVVFAAAFGLDRSAPGKGGAALRKALKKARAVEERCLVLKLVKEQRLVDPDLTELLVDELEARDWRVRAEAAEALGVSGAAEAVEPVVELLRRSHRRPVRIACVRALGALRQPGAVEVLIELLDELTGRLAHEAGLSLSVATGMNLGQRSASWQRWWTDHRDTFEPAAAGGIRWDDVSGPEETFAFYGIPVVSDRLAFVLDVSGSMQGAKLGRLKKELGAIIERLPEHCLFNMVFFAGSVNPWRKKLQPMTDQNRKAANEEVRDRLAGGGTNLWGGLLEAFEDEEVDTIYLLSDGEPTAGKVTNLATICDRITEMNEYRRVAIHVVVIGMKSRELRDLALGSGGTYVEHRL